MSKRTDTFLFVLIQKISSVGVQTGVVLYGCVTLLMTSFDVQQHHGAARHFTSVSAIAQEQIFPNWDMPANCWWCGENLVEFGRIDLEAERLNCGVLKRKTDLRGGPLIWIWCPDSESNQGHGDFQSPALPTELSGQRGALKRFPPAKSTPISSIHHAIGSITETLCKKRETGRLFAVFIGVSACSTGVAGMLTFWHKK